MDVFVVSSIAEASLGREAAEASVLLRRPVEIRRYTPEKLMPQLASGNAVLGRILAGPKRWIVGDEARGSRRWRHEPAADRAPVRARGRARGAAARRTILVARAYLAVLVE